MMLFSVILYFFWEAMLVSYLAVDVQVLPFNGIETFMSSSNYKMASQQGWYAYSVQLGKLHLLKEWNHMQMILLNI